MNQKILKEQEVQAFVEALYAEKRWAISVEPEGEDYKITWIEHKKYVSYTGETHHDEIWRTEDGTLMCVQDMEPEHARNALRMLLRSQRMMQEAVLNTLEKVAEDDDFDLTLKGIVDSLNDEEVSDGSFGEESPYYHGKKPTLQ